MSQRAQEPKKAPAISARPAAMTIPATTPLPPAAAAQAPVMASTTHSGDQRDAERHGAQDRACVPFRPLTGSQPPDEEARKGDEPERHEPPNLAPSRRERGAPRRPRRRAARRR